LGFFLNSRIFLDFKAARLLAEAEALGQDHAEMMAEKARKEAEALAAAELAKASLDTSVDNVFAVSIFCIDPTYEKRSVDFLEPMFQVPPCEERRLRGEGRGRVAWEVAKKGREGNDDGTKREGVEEETTRPRRGGKGRLPAGYGIYKNKSYFCSSSRTEISVC
jgi:hypothetical protein